MRTKELGPGTFTHLGVVGATRPAGHRENVVQRTDWQTEGRTEAYGSSGEETRDGERKSAGRPVMLKGSTGDFGEAGGSLTEEAFSAGQWGANGVREKTRK